MTVRDMLAILCGAVMGFAAALVMIEGIITVALGWQ